MAQDGRIINNYHADNSRFVDNGAINQKDQKKTFCGLGAHHHNGIVENKNNILTNGARTILPHGTRMWPQMIDGMFWTFSMKAISERLIILHIDNKGRTPEYILHGVNVEDIPVKSFHTLFSPI